MERQERILRCWRRKAKTLCQKRFSLHRFDFYEYIIFDEESPKVLGVGEIKQSLSSFSFAKEDTEFKPPKKTKGGKEKICLYAVETLYLSLSTNQNRILWSKCLFELCFHPKMYWREVCLSNPNTLLHGKISYDGNDICICSLIQINFTIPDFFPLYAINHNTLVTHPNFYFREQSLRIIFFSEWKCIHFWETKLCGWAPLQCIAFIVK